MSGVLGLRESVRVVAAVVSLGLVAGFVTLGANSAAVAAEAAPVAAPVVDGKSAPDDAGASAIAKKFGHEVVVDSSTTSTNQVTALPNGTMRFEASSVPVRAKVGGIWKPVDLGLTSSSGFLSPSVTTQPVQFSAGGDGPLARVQQADGSWVSEASPFGVLPKPSVKGPTATYANVLPDVDLQVTATASGMSEVMVVKNAAAAANPKLAQVRFAIGGADLTTDTVGNARVKAKVAGAKGLTAGTPRWWDSSQGSTAEGPGGTLMPRPVTQQVAGDAVTLDAGAAATSSGVQYPVFIDPDWSNGDAHAWFIDAGFPNQAYLDTQGQLWSWVGYRSGSRERGKGVGGRQLPRGE